MEITFKGEKIHTIGKLPTLQSRAPDFTLVKTDLSNISLVNIPTKKIVLNIFISLDTPVCALSVKKFNKEAASHPDTFILNVSMDLPFALQRFCAVENIHNAIAASAFKSPEFGKDYGLTITDGPLSGLLSRAVVIIDGDRNIRYTEQVPEITKEPDYTAALKSLNSF